MDDGSACLFRHAMLRDACYQLQLPQEPAVLHALAYLALQPGNQPCRAEAAARGFAALGSGTRAGRAAMAAREPGQV